MVASPSPTGSSRTGTSERVSGTHRSAEMIKTMPTGRLIKKMLRQPIPNASLLTSQPPNTGPMTADRPETPPTTPSIAARSRGEYRACSVESSCGTIIAAKPPWTTRATSRTPMDGAMQANSDPAVKPATPITNTRRRPAMSPSRPPVIISTAKASR